MRYFIFFCFFSTIFIGSLFAQDTVKIETRYLEVYDVEVHIAKVGVKQGILGDTGQVLLPFAYDKISFFNASDTLCTIWNGFFLVEKDGLFALANHEGKPLTALDYESIDFLIASCQSAHPSSNVIRIKKNGKYGLSAPDGAVLIRPAYDELDFLLDVYQDSLLAVPEMIKVRKGQQYGLFDLRTQTPLFRTEYAAIDFLQSLEVGKGKKSKKVRLLRVAEKNLYSLQNVDDKKPQTDFKYDKILPFYDERALVQRKGKFGFLDLDGKEHIATIYDHAESFRAEAAIVRKGKNYGLINIKGDKILALSYDEIKYIVPADYEDSFYRDFLQVKKGDKYGLANSEGKLIFPITYKSLRFVADKYGFELENPDGSKKFEPLSR
ncbi:MAG: WG repeat-containing protein [Bernardetiaceae bacterium]|nr:WG repeat-containing protein [Bernardetiaceae bacterium]